MYVIIFILVIILAFAYVQTRNRWRKKYKYIEHLPPILRKAKCVMSEVEIDTKVPVPLHGKPDQVFELEDRRLVIIDTKRRERVATYKTDIVQMSVYATILKNMGYEVCDFAFVRIKTSRDDHAQYLRVKLYPQDEIVKLHARYIDLKQGRVVSKCTCGKHC